MALHKLNIQSGVNQQQTQTLNSSSYWASNLIRWRDGMVERIGGWAKLFTTQLAGLARSLHAFEDLSATNNLLIGTDGGAQVYSGTTLYDLDLIAEDSNIAGASVSTAATGLGSVDYVNGRWFVGTQNAPGTAYTSTDGVSWTLITLPNDVNGNKTAAASFAYGNGVYVTGGINSLSTLTSADGITWAVSSGLTLISGCRSVAFGAGVFVLVNYSGQVWTSPDGATWTQRTPSSTFGWGSVAFGAGIFCAVSSYSSGGSAVCMTSPDGITWTARAGLPYATSTLGWARVRFVNSLFMVTNINNNTNSYTSTNGITWTLRTLPANTGWNDLTFGNALYVLVGNNSAASGKCIITSPDLVTWTQRTSPNEANQWTGIAYNGSTKFVAVCDLAYIGPPYAASSANGTTWSTLSVGNTTTVSITDTTYSPAVGSTVQLPITVSIGGTILLPASYTVTTANSTTGIYTITVGGSGVGAGSTAVPPLFVITLSQVGTQILTVILPGHGYTTPGQLFPVDVLTDIDVSGVTLTATSYTITQVLDTSTFLINTGQTSTAVNQTTAAPSGYYEGADNFTGTILVWYQTSDAPTSVSNWYTDNLGQTGLVMFTNGPLYAWTPPIDVHNVAVNVQTGSQINAGMLVAMPQAQVIEWGCQPIIGSGVADPLLIRFSDVGDYTTWVADATNQAGSYRLSRGSRIIGGTQLALTTLIWTDTDVWTMAYQAPPYVYSFNVLASNCGLISPNAHAILGGTCFWMGQQQFYSVGAGGGGVKSLYCPVWDIIFNDLDQDNLNKINLGSTSQYNEIMVFYPSASGGTGEVDKYVKITQAPNGQLLWDYGTLGRTAWLDQSVFGNALGGDLNSHLQQHDIGYNADGEAMVGAFVETGYADIGDDGDHMMLLTEIEPDMKWFGTTPGAIEVTLKSVSYAQGPIDRQGPFGMDMANRHVRPRIRARTIALRWDWVTRKDYNARIGAVKIRVQPSGRRPW